VGLRSIVKRPPMAARASVVALSLVLAAGCSDATGDDAGGADGGGETITLSFASGLPENLYVSEAYADWAEKITERTEGRVQFENYFGGALVPQDEVIKAVTDGQVQLGQYAPNTAPDVFRYSRIESVPGATSDLGAAIFAYRDLYESFEPMEEEWAAANQVPLLFSPTASPIFASTKELNSLEDIRGMRVRASGPMITVLESLGATSVTLPQVEIYEGLQRGVVDAATSMTLPSAGSQSIGEVAPRIYDLGVEGPSGAVVVSMNKEAYDALPSDIKDIFAEASGEGDAEWLERLQDAGGEACEPLKEQGAELIEWDDAQKKELQDAAFGASEDEYKASFPEAEEYWDQWQDLMEQYDGEFGNFDGSDISNCLE
jgi:TRAP-type C4-dicarboxylate transport system substrate-binding protein